MITIDIQGELIEVGEFNNEPGHGLLLETAHGEVFIGGLSKDNVRRIAPLHSKKVTLRLQVGPEKKRSSARGMKVGEVQHLCTCLNRRPGQRHQKNCSRAR